MAAREPSAKAPSTHFIATCSARIAARPGARVWAWCRMPNHMHLILVPSDPDGLRRVPAADPFDRLRAAESIVRLLGRDRFLPRIQRLTGRVPRLQALP